jgi:hypothetical protein
MRSPVLVGSTTSNSTKLRAFDAREKKNQFKVGFGTLLRGLLALRRTCFPNRAPARFALGLIFFAVKLRAALRTLFQGEQFAVEHDCLCLFRLQEDYGFWIVRIAGVHNPIILRQFGF